MKKIISVLAIVTFMVSLNGFAQEPQEKKKDKTATIATEEKKSCSSKEKKAGCCSVKKAT